MILPKYLNLRFSGAGLIKTRDKLLAELGELNKSKRYGTAEEAAKSDCAGLESRLAVLGKEMVKTTL